MSETIKLEIEIEEVTLELSIDYSENFSGRGLNDPDFSHDFKLFGETLTIHWALWKDLSYDDEISAKLFASGFIVGYGRKRFFNLLETRIIERLNER